MDRMDEHLALEEADLPPEIAVKNLKGRLYIY